MKPLFDHVYLALLEDLSHFKRKDLPRTTEIKCCFRLCYTYWKEISTGVSSRTFKNTHEEIQFFKHIKPLFTSEMEYYLLLYHAQLFQPEVGGEDRKAFWLREKGRLAKFIQAHQSFVAYYKKGCTDKDDVYFTKSTERINGAHLFNLYEGDDDLFSAADHLVTTLLSLEKYTAYIQSFPGNR